MQWHHTINEPHYNKDPVITNNIWKPGRITVKWKQTCHNEHFWVLWHFVIAGCHCNCPFSTSMSGSIGQHKIITLNQSTPSPPKKGIIVIECQSHVYSTRQNLFINKIMSKDKENMEKSSWIWNHNKTHIYVNVGFFSGISSCEQQNFDMMKSQLSFVHCFTTSQHFGQKLAELNLEWENLFRTFVTWFRLKHYLGRLEN